MTPQTVIFSRMKKSKCLLIQALSGLILYICVLAKCCSGPHSIQPQLRVIVVGQLHLSLVWMEENYSLFFFLLPTIAHILLPSLNRRNPVCILCLAKLLSEKALISIAFIQYLSFREFLRQKKQVWQHHW